MKSFYLVILAVVGALILGFIVFQTIRMKDRGVKNYETFYYSKLEGKLEDIQISVGVVYLKLSNNENRYTFIPLTSHSNKNIPFFRLAAIGDSVIKPSKSDTLNLIKGKEIYKYTFQKF